MNGLIDVVLWLLLTALGVGLAIAAGRLARVLSRRHRHRTQLPLARVLLALLLGWALLAIGLMFYASGWYLLSVAAAVGCFYGVWLRHPVQPDVELLWARERRRSLAADEQLVAAYEQVLAGLASDARRFQSEALLPAPKVRLAAALRRVYWAWLTELGAPFSRAELIERYVRLTSFLKEEDAAFMNKGLNLLQNGADTVSLVKQDPEYFILLREQMNRIYQRVNDEHSRLMQEWYRATPPLDDE